MFFFSLSAVCILHVIVNICTSIYYKCVVLTVLHCHAQFTYRLQTLLQVPITQISTDSRGSWGWEDHFEKLFLNNYYFVPLFLFFPLTGMHWLFLNILCINWTLKFKLAETAKHLYSYFTYLEVYLFLKLFSSVVLTDLASNSTLYDIMSFFPPGNCKFVEHFLLIVCLQDI